MWKQSLDEEGVEYLDAHLGGLCYIRAYVWGKPDCTTAFGKITLRYANMELDCLGKTKPYSNTDMAKAASLNHMYEALKKAIRPVERLAKKGYRK